MRSIEIKIELVNINGWFVNWEDENEAKKEILILNNEVRAAIAKELGIDLDNIFIKSKLIEPEPEINS